MSEEDLKAMDGIEPPEVKPSEKPKVEQKAELVAREDGALIGKTLSEQYRLATMYVSSGMVPKAFKRPEQVVTAMQYAVGIGLPATLVSLRNISVINGQAEIWGELPLKLVRQSGQLESIEEYLIDKEHNRIEYVTSWEMIFAAVCVVKRKGCDEKTVTWTKFQAEQAIHGIQAIWKGYYDVMMKRKCRAIALKDEFGDVLGGVQISEYDSHNAPDLPSIKDVNPAPTSTASELADL